MANGRIKESEVPLCAFVTLLLTHCYSLFAILDRRVYVDEDLRRNYRLEDFLWSGSGDGENETEPSPVDEQTSWERITTVFHTTTVISTATIFYKTLSVTTPESNITTDCINDPDCIIEPTPTIQLPSSTAISPWPPPTEYPYGDAVPDKRYWLITILKVNASVINFVPNELEDHLAKLYKIAFHRHQEHHLGLNATRKSNLRSQRIFRQKRDPRDRVTVHIHNVTNEDALKILYSVKVSGHPVLATTAAHDMRLVSDAEVVAELGFPILTKAEPYLKPSEHLPEGGSFREKEYLFVLVSSICAAVLIILFILLLLLTVKKHKKRAQMENRKTEGAQFLRNEDNRGIDNEAFLHESTSKSEQKQHSPKQRNGQSDSTPEGSHGRHQSQCRTRPHTRRPVSPNSFLSKPTVRDFPTSPLPEPLSNLLNNGSPPESQEKPTHMFSRHGSLEAGDPGVVGPVVWDTHCQRYKKQVFQIESTIEGEDESSFDSDIDVGKVRRRFNELLDDALSLYESHRSPHKSSKHTSKTSFDHRSQSAAHFREAENVSVSSSDARPKTSMNANEQRQSQKCFPQPRGAWDSNPTTPARLHSRPLSAGPFHRPTIYPEFIVSDAQLSPNDPAVPIISAIKQELDKIPTYKRPTKFVTLREPCDDHEA